MDWLVKESKKYFKLITCDIMASWLHKKRFIFCSDMGVKWHDTPNWLLKRREGEVVRREGKKDRRTEKAQMGKS